MRHGGHVAPASNPIESAPEQASLLYVVEGVSRAGNRKNPPAHEDCADRGLKSAHLRKASLGFTKASQVNHTLGRYGLSFTPVTK